MLLNIFNNLGFENYWQITFLVLGIVIIACNIGLMFVHEPQPTERQIAQKETDQMIEGKLGSSGAAVKIVAWVSGTIAGPIISFFKRNGFKIALGILGFVFLFKIGEAFLGRMSIIFYKEIGFSKGDIALYSKGIGWITTVLIYTFGRLICNTLWSSKSNVYLRNINGCYKSFVCCSCLVWKI